MTTLPQLLIEDVRLWGKGTFKAFDGRLIRRKGGRLSHQGTAVSRHGNIVWAFDNYGDRYAFFLDSGKSVNPCPYDFMEFIDG